MPRAYGVGAVPWMREDRRHTDDYRFTVLVSKMNARVLGLCHAVSCGDDNVYRQHHAAAKTGSRAATFEHHNGIGGEVGRRLTRTDERLRGEDGD